MSTYLVTGVAGFIASKVAEQLLAAGHTVVGVDNLNDYYDVRLKDWRLSRLLGAKGQGLGDDPKKSVYSSNILAPGSSLSALSSGRFAFYHLDIENLPALDALFAAHRFDAVFNLAARAGVRYSMENPHVYLSTNTLGTLNLLECQRKYGIKKQVLASTSSLYAGCPMPFTEDQPVNTPLSPYAATKKAAEMLAYTYHKLYGLDITVVRYFTVFGPAGRPDMAPYRFVHWVATGQPIKLFGDGTASRDFTYVDDIARGTILAGRLYGSQLRAPSLEPLAPSSVLQAQSPQLPSTGYDAARQRGDGMTAGHAPDAGLAAGGVDAGGNPEGVSGYNIINLGGGNRPITINAMIALIEKELNAQSALSETTSAKGQGSGIQVSALRSQVSAFKAVIDHLPINPVDMTDTQADITKAGRLLGWKPEVTPEEGFRKTVEWYLANRGWLKDIRL